MVASSIPLGCMLRRLCVIILVISELVNGLPESGSWIEKVNKNTTLVFHRSMLVESEIHLRIVCLKPATLSVSWIILQSPCFEMFFGVDTNKLANNMADVSFTSADVTFVRESKTFSCVANNPIILEGSAPILPKENQLYIPSFTGENMAVAPGLLAKVWDSGAHLLILKVGCPENGCSFDANVELEMRNPTGGYLSALEAPFLPFNGVMSLLYLIALIVWLVFIVRYWRDLMRIQICITILLMVGLCEHLTFFAVFENIRNTGQVATSAVYFAELLTCMKRTIVRVLMLVACLGYGITKPRLGTIWFRRCLAIGVVFFILLLLETIGRVSEPRMVTTPFRLVTVAILSCMDTAVMWWMFTYLARTLRETRMRRNLIKHSLYRRFSYVLVVAFLVSLSFLIASFELFKHHPCIKNWRFLWIDESFWHLAFFALLVVIMALWRPTGSNRDYAYSLLDNPIETTEDDEEVLLDRLAEGGPLTEVRSRQGEDEIKHSSSDTDLPRHDTSAKSSAKGPIPASLVERMGIEASSGPNDRPPVWKVD